MFVGLKVNVIGIGTLITLAVYILLVYQLSNCVTPLNTKTTHSGLVSRIGKISAIYLLASYCDGT